MSETVACISKEELENRLSENGKAELEKLLHTRFSHAVKADDKFLFRFEFLQNEPNDNDDLILWTDFKTACAVEDKPRNTQQNLNVFDFFYGVLTEKTEDDFHILEKCEAQLAEIEEKLLREKRVRSLEAIVENKKLLLHLKRHFDAMQEVLDLVFTAEEEQSKEKNPRGELLMRRMERAVSEVKTLTEYAAQVRETYQARVDIDQNKLMKVFTLITAIFLPLQLITGWYGMNLKMPETEWTYAYLGVIAVCIAIVVGCVWFFKKRKWF